MTGNFRVQEERSRVLAEVSMAPYSKCDSGNFKPDSNDCTKYSVCDNGNYLDRICPSGLHWNGRFACTWPKDAGCKKGDGDKQKEEESNNVIGDEKPQKPMPEQEQANKPDKKPIARPEYPTVTVPDTGKKVVCYFTNWAWYRQERGKYTPDDIDPALCTHVMYGFAVLDHNTLLMKPHDTWADLDNKFYEKVTALKAKGIKVLIALGGWNDSEGDKYSRLVSDASSRAAFIEHALKFIKKYDFDGLDLDWEYPKCWQVNCDRGPASDKANFATFVKELRQAFNPHDLLLTAAVSPSKAVIDQAYDVPSLSRDLDIINVMTYDYHGHWDKKTGHVAPLKDYEGSTYDYFNAVCFFVIFYFEKETLITDRICIH